MRGRETKILKGGGGKLDQGVGALKGGEGEGGGGGRGSWNPFTNYVLTSLYLHRLQKCLCWGNFLIKLQARRSAMLLKRDLNTSVFLKIL